MLRRLRTPKCTLRMLVMTTKKGFNGQGIIDLADYEGMEPREQNDAVFQNIDWLDLDTVDLEDPDYWNLAIRTETPEERNRRVSSLQVSYNNEGFLTKFWPVCFGTDGKPRDGRGRIESAKKNGERWMPKANYHYEKASEDVGFSRNYITNGLVANYHLPSEAPKMEDFIQAGVSIIEKGELICTRAEVNTWLYGEAKVEKFFSDGGGVITKIIDAILKRGPAGSSAIKKRTPGGWIEWIKDNVGYVVSNKKGLYLLCVDSETYPMRAWCQYVLSAVAKQKVSPSFILYTNANTPEEARKNMHNFVNRLKYFNDTTFRLVNQTPHVSEIGAVFQTLKFEIRQPETLPYSIFGAVPQIDGEHDLTGKNLVPIEEY